MKSSIPRIILTTFALATAPMVGNAQEFRVDTSTTGLELDKPAEAKSDSKKDKESEAPKKAPTEITASKETTFDEKTRTVVFIGDVTVKDAEFNLTCEKLTAILKKEGSADKDKNAAPVAEAAGGKEPAGGGLERAVAEGKVFIVQEKPDEKGNITRYVGRAARVEYIAGSGDVILTGWPQIQQGLNNQVATEEGTKMILNKNGKLTTTGGSKTVIASDTPDAAPRKSNTQARNNSTQ